MLLTLPLNFGERPCDRTLLALLRDHPRSAILWSAFLVWKDFGIARDDRREVPLDHAQRMASPAVAIIEQFCGWDGLAGAFVEAAITAGFFTLTPVTDTTAELVLVDFFPANHSGARDITNSKLGGIAKGVNAARKGAERSTREQLSTCSPKVPTPCLPSMAAPNSAPPCSSSTRSAMSCADRNPPPPSGRPL